VKRFTRVSARRHPPATRTTLDETTRTSQAPTHKHRHMLALPCIGLIVRSSPLRQLSRGDLTATATATADHPLASLLELADHYDAFLLDQFGVIHDGKTAYEGAIEAVSELQRRKKKIVIISNSSRRKRDTLARLRAMGFESDIGRDEPPISVVTSGDLVWEGLAAAAAPPFADLGLKCTVFGNGDDDEEYVCSCGKVAVPIAEADFLLARGLFSILGTGPDLLRQPFSPYSAQSEETLLREAMARRSGGLPLLVANPDTSRPDGKDSPMPGLLAARYRAMGATDIRMVGKPHELIYDACRKELATAGLPPAARVAAVGDSLHHDVLGAAANGIDSVFICGGVHYRELGVPQAAAVPPTPAKLAALIGGFAAEHEGVIPTHTLAGFRLS
jgi:HAD superfamily hydrolase (TIGR01459 family)